MASSTMLTIAQVQTALRMLGYYDGPTDGDYHAGDFREDLKLFQRDYGLDVDGWYGAQTEKALLPLLRKVNAFAGALAPEFRSCRRWQLTYYYVGEVAAWTGPLVPMKTPNGSVIAKVPAGAFAEAALEGATQISGARIAGVAGGNNSFNPAYSACDAKVFQPVYDIAKRNGWIPGKPGYAGIQLTSDGSRAASSRNFEIRKTGPKGWPLEAKQIECDPFRTIAADNGLLPKHDPRFKGKGGVVPAGTRVWILELAGVKLPDGTTHDGFCTVNDTGGGIYGAHFDVFTGTRRLAKQVQIPSRAHVWFVGIEDRLPKRYSYGL